ncbi:two-component response regulator [Geminocystis sp. NIES-3708]|uniref:response regulator transcription factor n=1 Tax=Geminocystis sp. NIES-3708 TaxID=1615909 RepID=UPI0005FC9B2D|nr:response regulator transcription factor [Geminocystis sp. NIES-3708]BAQ59642.1 two-component response regulator [Geminocystis sp. NIES-3708]
MEAVLAKILIVDDDIHIANLITRFLKQKNYQVKYASDGKTAREIFNIFRPDLVILDINLPDTLGYNLCEEMQNNNDVFILMLTSRTDVEDKKKGFLIGADDYLTKPFDLEELEFRVQAILRRRRLIKSADINIIELDNLIINPETREIKYNNHLITFTSLEFDLLYFLASNPGKVWRREELVANVWQNNPMGDNRVVDVHIGQIRRKIEIDPNNPQYIITIRGVGYKFEDGK